MRVFTCLTLLVFINFLFSQKAKQYYSYGEDEEFQCYTGFELDGFQFISCLPDGTWSQPSGRCISKAVNSDSGTLAN